MAASRSSSPAPRRAGLGAIAVALVLALFASFSFGVGVNTAWARRTLLDTDVFLDTISRPLLADPKVKDALARDLTQQAIGDIDFGQALPDIVPFEWRVMASQLGDDFFAQVQAQLGPAIRSQLDTEFVVGVWDQASRELHRQLVEQLSSGTSATTIDVNLHQVLVTAIHDVGITLQKDFPLVPFVTQVVDSLASQLPPDTGTVPIDVSDVPAPTRFVIAHATEIETGLLVAGFVALGLALVISRRRGLTVIVFGAGLVVMAAATYGLFAMSFADAGSKVAAHATTPISPDLQSIIDAQAALIVGSYRPWAGALAIVGIVVTLVGAVLAARRTEPPRSSGGSVGPGRPIYAADAPTPVMASGWDMPSSPPVR